MAAGSIFLQDAATVHSTLAGSYSSKSGTFFSRSVQSEAASHSTQAVGSTLSGATVAAIAGQDLQVVDPPSSVTRKQPSAS